jgi:predicted metal-dependent hydrolase
MKSELELIHYPVIGKVQYNVSNKAKYVRLSVDSSKKIYITIPQNYSLKNAEKFLHSKIDWIKKQFIKIDQRNNFTLQNTKNNNSYISEEAKNELRERLNELSEIYGLSFNRTFIRSQKTRWGSCSAKNNINLNIKLISLPGELRDYVIMHELVHTKVKNHGKQFWLELAKYYPDPKTADRKLKKYNLDLM